MIEALGLAVAAEIPIVVVDVMRGGPSTGIPDQNRAERPQYRALRPARRRAASRARAELGRRLPVHDAVGGASGRGDAGPGDRAVRPVLRPGARGGRPARRYRPVGEAPEAGSAETAATSATPSPQSGVSPMAIPGKPGTANTPPTASSTTSGDCRRASGGRPPTRNSTSARTSSRTSITATRWAEVEGEGDLAVVTLGSCTGAAREAIAARRRGDQGAPVSAAPALPSRPADLAAAALAGAKRVLVVEQNPHRPVLPLPARRVRPAGRSQRVSAGPGRCRSRPAKSTSKSPNGAAHEFASQRCRAAHGAGIQSPTYKPIWCPGCGDYSRACPRSPRRSPNSQLPPENVAVVSGIGCSSRIPAYTNCYGFHGVHGRSLAAARPGSRSRAPTSPWSSPAATATATRSAATTFCTPAGATST